MSARCFMIHPTERDRRWLRRYHSRTNADGAELDPCLGPGGYHEARVRIEDGVALAVGRDEQGRILCLGGNQGDKVSVAPFDEGRVLGYRWPLGYPLTTGAVPIIDTETQSSTGER